jgi:Fe2+ transport system protein B
MSIIKETEKSTKIEKFLTSEELQTLKEIQEKNQEIMLELGEISMIKFQIENRHEAAKNYLNQVNTQEKEFSKNLFEKYGKFNLNPKTGEIIVLD